MNPIQIWGGLECNVRGGDRYLDPQERTTHGGTRPDVGLLHGLGFETLRCPVLWEQTTRDGWGFADRRLAEMRDLWITPVVGLLHPGSGAPGTDLLDDRFPELFAEYAERVARRYPWVTYYVPINEPLTTARFSCLHGHWYPHLRDEAAFARAVVAQCRATALAMARIRQASGGARLVQTEDLGRADATPGLREQPAFEDERRWLTLDLLTGRVARDRSAFSYLIAHGVRPADLEALERTPCVPDILGMNHHVTPERFLDERVVRHPGSSRGGTGHQLCADVGTVRVDRQGGGGLTGLLLEAWDRYRIPLALTELQLAGPPEGRVRWLRDGLEAVEAARDRGADVVAVTARALLGAYDRDGMVTREADHGRLRPGRLAAPATDFTSCPAPAPRRRHGRRRGSPVLVTGAAGRLGRVLAAAAAGRGWEAIALGHGDLDITDGRAVAGALEGLRPWSVVNAAGYVDVDGAERDEASCHHANVTGAVVLARACAAWGVRLSTFSSDLVFDGAKACPYVETDQPAPLGAYGRSKARSEIEVLAALPSALVVRTSAFFGQGNQEDFVTRSLASLRGGVPFDAASDVVVSPTYVPDLADAVLDLVVDGVEGVVHVTSLGAVSWADLAIRAARLARLPEGLVRPVPVDRLGLTAPRPRLSALASDLVPPLPSLDDALERCVLGGGFAS